LKKITVLGSTGSIGVNTLDVVARHPDRMQIVALTANRDVDRLLAQCRQVHPRLAVMADAGAAARLRAGISEHGLSTEVLAGEEGLSVAASLSDVQCVVAGIVGAAGLLPTLAAASAGKHILLANKEALVMAGNLFMDAVRKWKATLLPVDSEHNAIFQCLPSTFGARGFRASGVRRILLTASGGPFRTRSVESLAEVTPDEACAHPNWVMGRKISVDSATMMNKGLEVIEAHWLFGAGAEQIQVVIHPQSIVHSMVEYVDGSVLAQLGNPDMRTPIAHALAWPERIESGVEPLNLFDVGRLDFEEPDERRFPCVKLAYDALAAGGSGTAVLNAANEVAVEAFLKGRLPFNAIASVIDRTLQGTNITPVDSIEDILVADRSAREGATAIVDRFDTA